MNSHSGHARGHEGVGYPPVVGGEVFQDIVAEIRLHMQNGAEFAAVDHSLDFDHGRLETAFMTHAEDHTGMFAGDDCAFGGGPVHGEGLLAEHVLAGSRGTDDLFFMQVLGRGQKNSLDLRVVEGILIFGGQEEPFFCGKGANRLRTDLDAAHESDPVVFALKVSDEKLAPPPETDDRCLDQDALLMTCRS